MREAGFGPAKTLSHMVSYISSNPIEKIGFEPCPFDHSGTPASKEVKKEVIYKIIPKNSIYSQYLQAHFQEYLI